MKNLYFLFFFINVFVYSQSIQLSPSAELSVITCGSSDTDLYATFGHSAFRIHDIPNNIDRVYNYGTFNFDTPNFYTKFVRGKLLYQLSAYDFASFLYSYHKKKRWVKGQVLDLTSVEVQKMFDFLENNAKPENRLYKYKFFYDNCSTRLYDVMEEVLGKKLVFDPNYSKEENLSHRELIQKYLSNHPWGDFGIDFALGSDIDRKATSRDYLFLPDYVFDAFTKVKIIENGREKPIVKKTEDILSASQIPYKNSFFTPLVVFSILAIIVLFFTYIDYKRKTRNKILDGLLFTITGVAGIVLLLLWFATDQTLTVNNFNILWAFAPNIIFVFVISKTKNSIIIKYYMLSLLLLLDLLVVLWLFKVQVFSIAMLPILIALYVRYIYLWVYFKRLR